MKFFRIILACLATTALLILLSHLSHNTYQNPIEDGFLRLHWRLSSQRALLCRPYTKEELRNLPKHMRQQEFCEQKIIPYQLVIKLNEKEKRSTLIKASGVREDRPLVVYEDLKLSPGEYALDLIFQPAQASEFANYKKHDLKDQEQLKTVLAKAQTYKLHQQIKISKSRITLIQFDEKNERFQVYK